MPILHVSSLDDERLSSFRNLKATNATRWSDTFIAEGEKLVERLLTAGYEIESLLVSERYLEQVAGRAPNLTLLVVPDDWVERIVGFNFHRGLLACARRRPPCDLRKLCSQQRVTLVVCPDVQDPENLGAILRCAGALGVDAVLLGSACCDPFSRRVLRVSMGAALHVPLRTTSQLANELLALREEFGVESWATVVDRDASAFDQLKRPDRLAVVFGNEGHGLAQAWQSACDRRVTIPMPVGVDSLNVAVAAGIILYSVAR